MGRVEYPLDLKWQIVEEYKKGEYGYNRLARKYGLKRDIVRYWVLNSKDIVLKMKEMKKDNNNKNDKKKLEYYKTKAMFFETYSKLLE